MRFFIITRSSNGVIVSMASFATREKARAFVARQKALGFVAKTIDRMAA